MAIANIWGTKKRRYILVQSLDIISSVSWLGLPDRVIIMHKTTSNDFAIYIVHMIRIEAPAIRTTRQCHQ